MFCPRCDEMADIIETDVDSSEARVFCRCSCGCEFYAVFVFDHKEIETEPPERKQHYQSETERDNPRDNIIEKETNWV